MKKILEKLKKFFFPPEGTPRWLRVLPYVILGLLTIVVLAGGNVVWEYTNSSVFCGTTCHTMPPEYNAYLVSPHARVQCVECHSEVHGSNHNSSLLDPDLGIKLFPNCYQSGCHSLNQ